MQPVLMSMRDISSPEFPSPSLRQHDINVRDLCKRDHISLDAFAAQGVGVFEPKTDRASSLGRLRILPMLLSARAMWRIPGGMSRLPRAMAGALGERVRYRTPVVSVKQTGDGVRVVALEEGRERAFEGDYFIWAAPLPPLGRVAMDPPLSAGKQRAIHEAYFSAVTRVAVQVRTRFWESSGLSGYGSSDDPMELWHTTFDQPGPGGHPGRLLQARRRARARGGGARVPHRPRDRAHGQAPAGPRKARARIDGQGLGRGSLGRRRLPPVPPGPALRLEASFRAAEGRVHFAGDHTSHLPGWMQGALASGHRVADENPQPFVSSIAVRSQ